VPGSRQGSASCSNGCLPNEIAVVAVRRGKPAVAGEHCCQGGDRQHQQRAKCVGRRPTEWRHRGRDRRRKPASAVEVALVLGHRTVAAGAESAAARLPQRHSGKVQAQRSQEVAVARGLDRRRPRRRQGRPQERGRGRLHNARQLQDEGLAVNAGRERARRDTTEHVIDQRGTIGSRSSYGRDDPRKQG
jgi:hypothetical protein